MENNMEMNFENEVAATTEFGVAEETKGFFERNKTTILASTVTGISTGIAGFFGGKFQERYKQKQQILDIRKTAQLIMAAKSGKKEVEINGETYETEKYNLMTMGDLQVFIMNEVLNNKKVNKDIKAQYREMLYDFALASAEIKQDELDNDGRIIRPEA